MLGSWNSIEIWQRRSKGLSNQPSLTQLPNLTSLTNPANLGNLTSLVISQLLLTRFWRNFKHRFIGLSWTAFNCHSNICPGNISPGDICPYQEYLCYYWPNFNENLKVGSCDHLKQISTVTVTFVQATFVLVTFVHIRNSSAVTDTKLTKF